MITRMLAIALLVFAGWIGVLAGVMLVSEDAPAALVLFPSDDFVANLPDDTAILSSTSASMTVTGETLALYRAGAILVLPAGLAGCFG